MIDTKTLELALAVCMELGAVTDQQGLDLALACYEDDLAKARRVRDTVLTTGVLAVLGESAPQQLSTDRQKQVLQMLFSARDTLAALPDNDGDARALLGHQRGRQRTGARLAGWPEGVAGRRWVRAAPTNRPLTSSFCVGFCEART
jgi:hypothetical protein